jgi:hypothetical protein
VYVEVRMGAGGRYSGWSPEAWPEVAALLLAAVGPVLSYSFRI